MPPKVQLRQLLLDCALGKAPSEHCVTSVRLRQGLLDLGCEAALDTGVLIA